MAIVKSGNKGKQSLSTVARNTHRERFDALYSQVGQIVMFAGATTDIPPGWLLCDGSEVLVSAFPELATMLTTYYGTPSSGDYVVLPDLQNHVPIGVSSGGLVTTIGGTLARTSATGSSFTFLGLYFIIRAY